MSDPTFSPQDAQNLIAHAQSAPLQHLGHAAQISVLLQRFEQWYHHAAAELESVPGKIEAAIKNAEEKVREEFKKTERAA